MKLDLSGAEFRALIDAVVDRLASHIDGLPSARAADTDFERSAALADRISEPFTDVARDLGPILDQLFDEAIPASFNTAGPGYMAYIPGGGLALSAAADLIANVINRYVGVWVAAPVLARLEADVCRWLCELVGFGDGSLGFLTTGGSLANLSALITARTAKLPENFLNGTLYCSAQTHHSVTKAAHMAGFPLSRVRQVPTDDRLRMRSDALVEQVHADRAAGWTPFCVVGNAGTTNTGAIDPLNTLADVAQAEDLFFHVDAAYGGFFLLTERGRRSMVGIERADSVTMDPHKALFLPYGTGALVVREAAQLVAAHDPVSADYLPDMQTDTSRIDYCRITPELSRDFRGLRVWLPLQVSGVAAFRDALDEKLDLTAHATEVLRAMDHVEILAEPQVTVVAFRWAPPGVPQTDLNALNQRLLDRINAFGNVHLTSTLLNGVHVNRICVLHFRTHRERVDQALSDIQAAITELSRSA